MSDDLKMCYLGRARRRKIRRNRFQFAQKLFLECLVISRFISSVKICMYFSFSKDHAEIQWQKEIIIVSFLQIWQDMPTEEKAVSTGKGAVAENAEF